MCNPHVHLVHNFQNKTYKKNPDVLKGICIVVFFCFFTANIFLVKVEPSDNSYY